MVVAVVVAVVAAAVQVQGVDGEVVQAKGIAVRGKRDIREGSLATAGPGLSSSQQSTPHIVEAAGWQADRLGALSQLVEQVPVRRLVYPNGVEHLPQVVDAILGAEA